MGVIRSLNQSFDRGEKTRLGGFLGFAALLHLVGFGLLLLYGMHNPALLGLGGLAYTFGLRHAFDADHIAAIDNTTRKLLQERGRPMGVGFFFSLGHSSVVLLIAVLLGLAVHFIVSGVVSDHGQLRSIGGLVGTGISGLFLLVIGLLNLVILVDIVRVYGRMRDGHYDTAALNTELTAGGFMTRVFGRMFRVVEHSWQMFPIGFLFGLGFDTASEVALLAISAGAASAGIPFLAVVSLPIVFAAGMCLMDTADGAFMAKAYSWAFSNPVRKVFYNMTVTSLSVFVALFVGLFELGQLLIGQLRLQGPVFDQVAAMDIGRLGFVIVAMFGVTWVAAFAYYKLGRVEERWSAMVPGSSGD